MAPNRVDSDGTNVEAYCNQFAGAFLVPTQDLLSETGINSTIFDRPDERFVSSLARKFWVSREVVLRRLLSIGKISSDYYRRRREEWQSLEVPKRRGGRSNPPKKVLQENGRSLVSLVIDGYKRERITYRDAGDFLTTKLKYLPRVEKLLGGPNG